MEHSLQLIHEKEPIGDRCLPWCTTGKVSTIIWIVWIVWLGILDRIDGGREAMVRAVGKGAPSPKNWVLHIGGRTGTVALGKREVGTNEESVGHCLRGFAEATHS